MSEFVSEETISIMTEDLDGFNWCKKVNCKRDTEKKPRNNTRDNNRFPNKMFSDLGNQAGLHGDTLYYPFGGEDSATPFALQPSATDVISWGGDAFGQPLQEFLSHVSVYRHFHYTHILEDFHIGGNAASNLHDFLGASIEGIFYFDLDKDGKAQFRRVSEKSLNMQPWQVKIELEKIPNEFSNALIVFRDPTTKRLKRFWSLQAVLPQVDKSFELFVRRLKFSTLLLKAAPETLFEDPKFRSTSISLTLDLARKNQARVITDERQFGTDHSRSIGRHAPRIFLKERPPHRIPLPNGGESFGYSTYTLNPFPPRDTPLTQLLLKLRLPHGIYVANADSLIDRDTPSDEIYMPTVLSDVHDTCRGVLSLIKNFRKF